MLIKLITSLLIAFFSFNFFLHLYWAFGGQWAVKNVLPEWEGKRLIEMWPIPTIIVAFGFLLPLALILQYDGLIQLNIEKSLIEKGFWLFFLVFMLRAIGDFRVCGLFKKELTTNFGKWDQKLFTPICIVISFMFFILIFDLKTI